MSERDRLENREWVIAEMNRLERQLQGQIAELRDELHTLGAQFSTHTHSVHGRHRRMSAQPQIEEHEESVPVPQSLRA